MEALMRLLSVLAIATLVLSAGCRTRTVHRTGPGPGPAPPPEFFADTFEECAWDTDCYFYPDDLCYTVVGTDVAGMCTYECGGDWDCPSFSVCEPIDGPWLCYLTCELDVDCPWGFGCFEVDQGDYFVDVCLPI
jgi:hypothetical protein